MAVTAAVLVLGLAACSGSDDGNDRLGPVVGPDGSALFSGPGSFWSQQVPAAAPVDPRSADYVRQLLTEKPLVSVNGWTVAVYEADAATPRYRVTAGADFVHGGWTLPKVPIPDPATPDPQDDGHMAVVDRSAQCVYEFWQAKHDGSTWSASWVNATPTDGDGVYPDGLAARGSGFSAAAGLIWPQELAAGHIDHALVFASPFTREGGPVPPATKSDGHTSDVPALPEGARLRLNPSLNLDTLGLTKAQHTIAVALQKYGMVLGDTGGGFTLYAAAPQSFESFPYPRSWSKDTWADISAIPFDKLQVLALPAETVQHDGAPITNRCNSDAVFDRNSDNS